MLKFFARLLWKIKKKEVKAIFAYFLSKEGVLKKDIYKVFKGIKARDLQVWGERSRRILTWMKYRKGEWKHMDPNKRAYRRELWMKVLKEEKEKGRDLYTFLREREKPVSYTHLTLKGVFFTLSD